MDRVTVVFTNGNIVSFYAQEFDVDLTTGTKSNVLKYPYKNARGEDSFIHLEPNEVVGIFVTKGAHDNHEEIAYTVAHRQ